MSCVIMSCHSVTVSQCYASQYHIIILYEGTTTVRSELQNHIEEIRTNNHIRNTPSKTQIKAKDLNDYLRVSPIDLKIERKEKTKSNIFDFIKKKMTR